MPLVSIFSPLEIMKEIMIALGAPKLLEFLKGLAGDTAKKAAGEAGADALKKYVKVKLDDEKRAELYAFIHSLSDPTPAATENLLRRWRDRQLRVGRSYNTPPHNGAPYGPRDEDAFEKVLVELYDGLKSEKEEDPRKQIFLKLGTMSDEDFDAHLEMLQNQHLRGILIAVWEQIDGPLKEMATALEGMRGGGRTQNPTVPLPASPWRIITSLYGIANFWTRVLIGTVLGWPIVMFAGCFPLLLMHILEAFFPNVMIGGVSIASIGSRIHEAIMMMIVFVPMVVVAFWFVFRNAHPLPLLLLSRTTEGDTVKTVFSAELALSILLGFYVDITVDPMVAAGTIVATIGLIMITQSGAPWFRDRILHPFLVFSLILGLLILALGGRSAIPEKVNSLKAAWSSIRNSEKKTSEEAGGDTTTPPTTTAPSQPEKRYGAEPAIPKVQVPCTMQGGEYSIQEPYDDGHHVVDVVLDGETGCTATVQHPSENSPNARLEYSFKFDWRVKGANPVRTTLTYERSGTEFGPLIEMPETNHEAPPGGVSKARFEKLSGEPVTIRFWL